MSRFLRRKRPNQPIYVDQVPRKALDMRDMGDTGDLLIGVLHRSLPGKDVLTAEMIGDVKDWTQQPYGDGEEWEDVILDQYLNNVLPNKYFAAWRLPDTKFARYVSYRMDPDYYRRLYETHSNRWVHRVIEDIRHEFRQYTHLCKEEEAMRA
jgi:hypothetical protein